MDADQEMPKEQTQELQDDRKEGTGQVISATEEKKSSVGIGKEKKQIVSPEIQALSKLLEEKNEVEEKISTALAFMRKCLEGSNVPRFKDFWEARRFCLPLFKLGASVKAKTAHLWQEFVEISAEARRVKDILDEQSVFACEQITLAIEALSSDLDRFDSLLSSLPEMDFSSHWLKNKREFYQGMQKELHILNTLAARIHALRKEVIKTEMRIRNKNKLFDSLSKLGDRVFPKRKDLIKEISEQFVGDVRSFVADRYADEETILRSAHLLREEIKSLQTLAKVLTLNTNAFTETRLLLSECWDKLKEVEKKRKKEFSEKREQYKQAYDQVMEKIQAFALLCGEEKPLEEINKGFEEVLQFMRSVELGHPELRALKEQLHKVRQPILDKMRQEQMAKIEKEQECEKARVSKLQALRQALEEIIAKSQELDVEVLTERRQEHWDSFTAMQTSKSERLLVERLFKQLKDCIHEKKSKGLLSLSDADHQQLEQLQKLLEESKERRLELKVQLETYRKALGGSGFDFEKAMMYRECIETEKESLEKMNRAIDDLEEKIAQIEG